jgi:hypothetical protein
MSKVRGQPRPARREAAVVLLALLALRHLEAGRGTHFDPVCLDAFLALMAERGHRRGLGTGDPAGVGLSGGGACRSVQAPAAT